MTTLDHKILPYIERICQRDPGSRVVTGGIVSCKDSSWLASWTISRQGQFKAQEPEKVCVWVYGLFTDVPGDFCQETDARMHWPRDHRRMALSSRRACGGYSSAGA